MEVKSEKVEQEHNKLGCFKHNAVKKGGGRRIHNHNNKNKTKRFSSRLDNVFSRRERDDTCYILNFKA